MTEVAGGRTEMHKGDKESNRIALLVEYDGTDFSGFQIQKSDRTVQKVLEEAIFAVYGEHRRVYGCSRTDAGVHARGHVSHVDVPFAIPPEKIPLALNTNLPDDVCVIRAKTVPANFHARFDSTGKVYTYRIHNDRIRPCMDRRTVAHVPGKLDIGLMRDAARYMIGTKDFSAFGAQPDDGRSVCSIRTVRRVDVRTSPDTDTIEITVEGQSFLYNMVRIMVGTLMYAGQKKIAPGEIADIFEKKDRRTAGKTMPASGLTLEKVFYDPPVFSL